MVRCGASPANLSVAPSPDRSRPDSPSSPVRLNSLRNAAQQPLPVMRTAGADARPWQGGGSMAAVLLHKADATWRVKCTGESALSAMEVTLSKVFQLTGLAAPDTALVDDVPSLLGNTLHVASRFDPNYQDLGGLLQSAQAEHLCGGDESNALRYRELQACHRTAVADCNAVLEQAGVTHCWALQCPDAIAAHAAADARRFSALEAMNALLRTDLRCHQLRHFVASRWLANWDHLNYRMENFGYTRTDRGLVGMTVDFGSCGPLGFRSLANGRMLPKQGSAETAMRQRPAALFPIPDAVRARSAQFDALDATPGLLGDTLRWPYGFQSDSIAEQLRVPLAPVTQVADTLAEMGYRLALVSDTALTAIIDRYWPAAAHLPGSGWPGGPALAQGLGTRRRALLDNYAPAQIADWIAADPLRADQVLKEVLMGTRAALEGLGADENIERAIEHNHNARARGAPLREPAQTAQQCGVRPAA